MTNNIYAFKTMSGETLLGDLYKVEETLGVLHIAFPIKLTTTIIKTSVDLINQYSPALYQPFGITNVVPFKNSFFVSIMPCSEFDSRYYMKVLDTLLEAETNRLVTTEIYFNTIDYPDVIMMSTPETIQ